MKYRTPKIGKHFKLKYIIYVPSSKNFFAKQAFLLNINQQKYSGCLKTNNTLHAQLQGIIYNKKWQ